MMLLPAITQTRGTLDSLLNKIHHADALDLLRRLPDASIDLIVTDPPYYLLDYEWDQQWQSEEGFINWLSQFMPHFKRILKPNGSIYISSSHKFHARIEVLTSLFFNVLNNIVWVSNGATTKRADRTMLRSYIPTTEHWIFAEHKQSDSFAISGSSYYEQYEKAKQNLRYGILADYLATEFKRAGVTNRQIASLFPSKTGNLTGCVSNWLLGYNIPTEYQYNTIRLYLNNIANGEFLRREYEDLRREYEDLRRPFFLDNAGDNECNVWYFNPESKRIHPTQKPLEMMEHILNVSTRNNAVVLDPFCGSGTTAIAARKTGRQFICGDLSAEYVEVARKRLQNTDPYQSTILPDGTKQLSLFENIS